MTNFRLSDPIFGLFSCAIGAAALAPAGCGAVADSVAMPGATAVPSELVPLQGRWKFDEARTRKEQGAPADEGEMSAEEKVFMKAMKQLGVVMSDIEIRGTQITQQGGLLQAQYDLLDYRQDGNRIVGTALWHEDRHDPGDATEIKVTLERKDNTLIFTREDEGEVEKFYFQRS